MTEPAFPIEPHDADRERIRARARLARDVLADLEEAAISAASRHGHQVDALKTELAEAQRQLATPSLPFPASMAVGLDDIRVILEEEKRGVIDDLVVVEDGQVQVIETIHQLLAHIIAVDTAWPASEMESLRRSLEWTQEELRKANAAAVDNAAAQDDYAAALVQDLQAAIDEMVAAITPINRPNAKLARLSNPIGAMRIITEVIEDVAKQILDGASGENAKALAVALADADRIEDEIHAIEAVCEAAGMPATLERADLPAWLAEHLTTRIERKQKVKKAKKVQADELPLDDEAANV